MRVHLRMDFFDEEKEESVIDAIIECEGRWSADVAIDASKMVIETIFDHLTDDIDAYTKRAEELLLLAQLEEIGERAKKE